MTEAGVNSTASLRRLVPRIFSKAQPAGRGRHAACARCGCTIRRPTSRSSSAPTRSPSARTRARSARAASRTSRTRSRSRRSSPTSASARRPSPRRCCTTRSRTPRTRSTRCAPTSATRSRCSSTASPSSTRSSTATRTQAETVRKMIVAMSKDIRVLIIKLADRLHNARTWGFVPAGVRGAQGARRPSRSTRRSRIASASRRSSGSSKTSRSPCSTRSSTPRSRASCSSARRSARSSCRRSSTLVNEDLKAAKIRGKVVGRPKQYYSIYQKMIVRGRDFDEIYDLVGIRVLVNSVRDCYAVLGAIHARWTPLPGRFKDYIATPKFNLYQSLHTTVIGPKGRAVEIQIRTHEMHQRAEFGVAAHWKYKERMNGGARPTSRHAERHRHGLARAHLRLAGRDGRPGGVPRLAALRDRREGGLRLHAEGPVIGLPAGATPVDFAYAVHTEVGHRTMGAKVNGRLVPLESELHERRRRRGLHLEEPRLRAEPGLAQLRQEPACPQQDPAVVHQGAPRRGDRAGPRRDRPRDAQAEPAAAEADEPGRRSPRWRPSCATTTSRRSTPPSARGTSRRSRCSRRSSRSCSDVDEGDEPDLPIPVRSPPAAAEHATPACSCAVRPTSSSSSPGAAPRCPATRSSASSPAARASRCTRRTATTCSRCCTSPSA